MTINNHKIFRDQLFIDYQYQSINWYRLSSIVIDCHRLSILSIVQALDAETSLTCATNQASRLTGKRVMSWPDNQASDLGALAFSLPT